MKYVCFDECGFSTNSKLLWNLHHLLSKWCMPNVKHTVCNNYNSKEYGFSLYCNRMSGHCGKHKSIGNTNWGKF